MTGFLDYSLVVFTRQTPSVRRAVHDHIPKFNRPIQSPHAIVPSRHVPLFGKSTCFPMSPLEEGLGSMTSRWS
jgi:hypothetical protein